MIRQPDEKTEAAMTSVSLFLFFNSHKGWPRVSLL